jgi:hypothetical protein
MTLPWLFLNGGKKQTDPQKDEAYHEASHVFVSLYYGRIPAFAMVAQELGRVSGTYDILFLPEDPAEASLAFRYAGIIGGAFYSGFYDTKKSKGDFDQVETLVRMYNISTEKQLRIWEDTHCLIEDNWDTISTVAEDLFREKVLTHEYFYELALKT